MSDIKPCPFCGNGSQVIDDLVTFCVECSNCGATGPISSYKIGAIEAWNARAAVQANVPDGWVMVPVEPTYKMLNAASLATESEGMVTTPWLRKTIWLAMLTAIPKG